MSLESLKKTPEQEAILAAARGETTSMMIQALAGTGKTTTLEMISHAVQVQTALAVAFNVSTKKELERRFSKAFQVKTMNGLGHVAFSRAIGRMCSVDDRKLGKLVTQITKIEGFEATTEQWNAIRELVSEAMLKGLIPNTYEQMQANALVKDDQETWMQLAFDCYLEPDERLIDFARKVLVASIKQAYAGILSYDEQIYMSTMFGGQFPRFPLVLVDEYQDLSPLNHIQVRRCAADRLIIVGDSRQSIYAFRGADADATRKLRALREAWIDLPLATTFRCPKIVVARQQGHAPGFTAFHTNLEGLFITLPTQETINAASKSGDDATWNWADVSVLAQSSSDTFAVLCRNNAPLLGMAFKLIRDGIPCHMLGREIGKGLITLSKKLLPDDSLGASECVSAIDDWRATEISKAQVNDNEYKIDSINDRADCLLAVLTNGNAKNAGALRTAIEALFAADRARVTLSTGHKAKGLEWNIVLHLDPHLIPPKKAVLAGGAALQQEKNLRYVIETRTKNVLIEARHDQYSSD